MSWPPKPKTGVTLNCKMCNTEFYVQRHQLSHAKYCSTKCYHSDTLEPILKACDACGKIKSYKYIYYIRSTCSEKCAQALNKTGEHIPCKMCGKQFYVSGWQLKRNPTYCSNECKNVAMTLPDVKLKCTYCKKPFSRSHRNSGKSKSRFCSVRCLCRHNNATGVSFARRTNTKPEQAVAKILKKLHIQFKQTFSIPYGESRKVYDFYLSKYNMLIEVDGTYWHAKRVRRKDMSKVQLHNRDNDKIKNRLAKSQGYKLIRIWEDEISEQKIKEILL